MKLKLKVLVASVVVATTMSSSANALVSNELFLVAYNSVTAKTFLAALGPNTVTGFGPTSNLSYDFTESANWSSFVSGGSYNSSDVKYQVLGYNVSNSANAGNYNAGDKLLVTSNTTPGAFSNSSMNALILDAAITSGTIGNFAATNAAATGTGTMLITGGAADSGAAVNVNFFNKWTSLPDATASLGQDLNFWAVTRPAGTTGLVQTVRTAFLQDDAVTRSVWNLASTGDLTYTVQAVPEADTSAMMIIGAGMLGLIARRRNNKV
jgi:hypothetical protein